MVVREVYISMFLLAAAGCFVALFGVRDVSHRDTRYGLYGLVVTTGLWAVAEALRLSVDSLSLASAVFTAGSIIGFGTVGAWLYFCSAYTGHSYHRNPRVRAGALAVFLLVTGFKLTNSIHGAYFVAREATQPFSHVAIELLTLHWVILVVAYVCSGVGFYMLFELFAETEVPTTRLAGLVSLAALPVVFNVLGVLTGPTLLALNYEPIGVAAFVLGVVSVSRPSFETVHRAGHHQVLDDLTEGIIVVDTDAIVRDANATATRLFPSVTIGEPLASTVPAVEEYLDRYRAGDIRDTEAAGKAAHDEMGRLPPSVTADGGSGVEPSLSDELMSVTRGGETRQYLVRETPLGVGTRQVGWALVFTDVTRIERQQRALVRREQQLRAIDNILRHNMRNSLNVIRGRADILRESTSGRSPADAAKIIDRTDELLTTSQKSREIIDALTAATDSERLDIAAVLERSAETVREEHPDADIECGVEDELFVNTCPMIEDAIEEVVTNAVIHNDQPTPTVQLAIVESDEGVAIEIVDDGPGISESERAILEDGAAVDQLFHGSGLGHWLVHWTVVRSGGSIDVSDAPSQGSNVEISI